MHSLRPHGFPRAKSMAYNLPRKNKRKRDEANAVVQGDGRKLQDEQVSGSEENGGDAVAVEASSTVDSGGGKKGESEATDEVADLLTPAQRRFRDKQLKREVRFYLPNTRMWRLYILLHQIPRQEVEIKNKGGPRATTKTGFVRADQLRISPADILFGVPRLFVQEFAWFFTQALLLIFEGLQY